MMNDLQLLQRYAKEGSEEAFRELVGQHLQLVYSTALRIVAGDTHLAQDVTQTVFTDVARKAATLARGVVLGGWLYRHTCFTASKAVRTERRHKDREKEAATMNALNDDSGPDAAWQQIAPLLDDAMNRLGARDRDAIVLRYFERRDLRTLGLALGTSEDAAQKRVSRAVEKLRTLLVGRGAALSTTALAAALTGVAAQAAPAGLAASISTTALAGAAAGTGVTLTLLKLMSLTNVKLGIVSAVVIASAATPMVLQHQNNKKLEAENQAQTRLVEQLRSENGELAKLRADAEELNRLRADAGDLPRLRSEVTRLRHEKTEAVRLLAENEQLKKALAQAAASAQNKEPKPDVLTPEEEEAKRQGIARLKYTRRWLLAFVMSANDNDGKLPADFAQAQELFNNAKNDPDDSNDDGLSPEQFEIVCAGKIEEVKKPAETILIREKAEHPAPGGGFFKAYGFVDGHSEIHKAASSDDFATWEKARIQSSPAK
jgi:RNA polymerase sigma factor (sigma-70 family)